MASQPTSPADKVGSPKTASPKEATPKLSSPKGSPSPSPRQETSQVQSGETVETPTDAIETAPQLHDVHHWAQLAEVSRIRDMV